MRNWWRRIDADYQPELRCAALILGMVIRLVAYRRRLARERAQ